jgi:hypothetical protein
MKVDLPLGKLKQLGSVLSMSVFVNSFRQSPVVRSGLQLLNVFVLMEPLSHLSSFLKRKTFHDNGFRRTFTTTGGSLAIQRAGPAIFIEVNGYVDVLNLRHEKKQQVNIVF